LGCGDGLAAHAPIENEAGATSSDALNVEQLLELLRTRMSGKP
jgi:hypothetical protein